MTVEPVPTTPAVAGSERAPTRVEPDAGTQPPLGDTWLLHKRQWLQLLAAYVVLTGLWVLAGLAIKGPLEDSGLVRTDERVARWLADHRTPRLDDVSLIGSWMAETITKIALTAVVAIVMLAVWRRWREPLMLIVPLVLEAAAFITITFLVRRPRPAVPRLDESPVDTAFPSGHVAAATCYGAIVVVALWRSRRRWWPVLLAVLVLAVTVTVSWARMYRGMHFLSDVVAGFLLGLAAVLTAWWILDRAPEGPWRRGRHPSP
jgi:membrane-associated phospholipid phosphatase